MIFISACNSISSPFAIGFYAAAVIEPPAQRSLYITPVIVLESPLNCTLFDMRPMIHLGCRGKIPLIKSLPEHKNAEAAAAWKAAKSSDFDLRAGSDCAGNEPGRSHVDSDFQGTIADHSPMRV